MKTTMPVVLAALCLSWPVQPAAAWELVSQGTQRGEVTSYVREVPGFAVKSFRGVVETSLPMSAVLAAFSDLEAFPNWVFQCKRVMRQPDWPEPVYYAEFKAPWPVSNREAVLRNQPQQDPQTLAVTVHTTAIGGYVGASSGRVRIPLLDNRFLFEPLRDGGTRISFETLVKPGGSIPAWVSNWVATSAPKETLGGLLRQAALPKYRNRSAANIHVRGLPVLQLPSQAN